MVRWDGQVYEGGGRPQAAGGEAGAYRHRKAARARQGLLCATSSSDMYVSAVVMRRCRALTARVAV